MRLLSRYVPLSSESGVDLACLHSGADSGLVNWVGFDLRSSTRIGFLVFGSCILRNFIWLLKRLPLLTGTSQYHANMHPQSNLVSFSVCRTIRGDRLCRWCCRVCSRGRRWGVTSVHNRRGIAKVHRLRAQSNSDVGRR